jgi:DNA-binding SARP family transcriptional activator
VVERASPPIQIVCFGGPRVLCVGQQVWPRPRAGAAKPWELLLYLACQPPEGVSREAVSQALWPDDDDLLEFGFTHRIRQLRYRLRTTFEAVPGGPTHDGIALERGGALRLDPSVAESDVQRFLQLIKAARMLTGQAAIARYEQARALYVSDLLDASDARRYAWAVERGEDGVTLREHFRRLYYQVTNSLAELCARADDPGRAIELYRELTELEPGDERLWIALLRVIASRGDRPTLLREERRYRDALRALDGDRKPSNDAAAEPSREVSLEFQRLLKEVDAHQRTPTAV